MKNKLQFRYKRVHKQKSLAARLIFKNMGIPLPGGTMEEVATVLATNDYMGWRKYTPKQAQICVGSGMVNPILTKNLKSSAVT